MALMGEKIGFEKVIKMIDEMVALLDKGTQDDAIKKEVCSVEIDMNEDKKKALEVSISGLANQIDTTEESLEMLTADIKALSIGIAALDKSVAEATEQRKEENEAYQEIMASDAQA
jgi:septal ring factor EnvC (AmiA/AmiB activator)